MWADMTTQEHDLAFPSCPVPEEIEKCRITIFSTAKAQRIPAYPRACGGEVAGLAAAPLEDDEQQGEHSVLITAAKPTRA